MTWMGWMTFGNANCAKMENEKERKKNEPDDLFVPLMTDRSIAKGKLD
jgi:hypothetical protein